MTEGGRLIQEVLMRLRTIGLIVLLVLGLLAAPLTADAQQAGKVYRIGYLSHRPGPSSPDEALA